MNSVILPDKWVKKLQEQPETGMGFQHVTISFNETDRSPFQGTVLNCQHLLAESDFPVGSIKDIAVDKGWGTIAWEKHEKNLHG